MTAPAEPLPPAPRCANCGAEVPWRFCGACGQERSRSLRIPFLRLAGEAAGELLSVDSKVGRTLPRLFLRPGAMTRAWLEGRRASHTSPVKLYLVFSFLFFLAGALRPEGSRVVSGGPEERVEVDDATLADLRASGALGAGVATRLEEMRRLTPAELNQRFGGALAENVPKAMFALVPALALFLRLAYRRSGVYFAEHLVFALHAHAVAFALALPGAALGHPRAQGIGFGLATLHAVLALRRAYGGTWWGTLWRAALAGWLYLLALGIALGVAAAAAFLLA